jgi:multiple sugar transport system substrate-binding protein
VPQNPQLIGTKFSFCSNGTNVRKGFLRWEFAGCKKISEASATAKPVVTMPTNCSDPNPKMSFGLDSWENPARELSNGVPDVTDPNWKTLLAWQKSLVDWYGYDKLTKFKAGLGDEFSADNAFQKGQVAINIDAEYRLAFLKDQTPGLKYGVAPIPTSDPARYGGGYVTGNVMGISKNAKNPEAAWELIKYLTTNDVAVTKLARLLKNVPTTTKAIADPALNADPDFKTFIDIFTNPNSLTSPPSASGPAYQETFGQFLTTYQSGKVADLDQGLADADKKINSVMTLGG